MAALVLNNPDILGLDGVAFTTKRKRCPYPRATRPPPCFQAELGLVLGLHLSLAPETAFRLLHKLECVDFFLPFVDRLCINPAP